MGACAPSSSTRRPHRRFSWRLEYLRASAGRCRARGGSATCTWVRAVPAKPRRGQAAGGSCRAWFLPATGLTECTTGTTSRNLHRAWPVTLTCRHPAHGPTPMGRNGTAGPSRHSGQAGRMINRQHNGWLDKGMEIVVNNGREWNGWTWSGNGTDWAIHRIWESHLASQCLAPPHTGQSAVVARLRLPDGGDAEPGTTWRGGTRQAARGVHCCIALQPASRAALTRTVGNHCRRHPMLDPAALRSGILDAVIGRRSPTDQPHTGDQSRQRLPARR